MANDREELERKGMSARNAEELAAILKDAGEEISPEEAAELFKRMKAQKELSLDELEAVAGGADRDWLKDGCAATVEPGSSCWGTDACSWAPVTYDNKPEATCEKCRDYMILTKNDGFNHYYTCVKCGHVLVIPNDWQSND